MLVKVAYKEVVVLYDIITVGSNTLDIFVKTDLPVMHFYNYKKTKGKKHLKDGTRIAYPLGEKILINHLEFQVGGGGTNTAVAFSRLGLKTAYLGKIGKDESGLSVFRSLRNEGVKFIGALGNASGLSVILDSVEDDRTILAYKGCNNFLEFKEVDKNKLSAKWFYFSSMIGDSLRTMNQLSAFASKNKIKIAFNPSSYMAKSGLKKLKPIIKNTSILILNKEESCDILGKKHDNKLDVREVLVELKKHISECVVITDGSNGAWCYDGQKILFAKPVKGLKIIETTGAGDAFAAGFTAQATKEKSIEECFRAGFIESEAVITAYGAKNNLLSASMLKRKLNQDKRKRKVTEIKLQSVQKIKSRTKNKKS